MKDDYKKLSNEWGSKRRKQDSRAAKSTLKKPTREDLAELDNPQMFRISMPMVNYAIENYDVVNPTGVLRLAEALKAAYKEIERLKGLIK